MPTRAGVGRAGVPGRGRNVPPTRERTTDESAHGTDAEDEQHVRPKRADARRNYDKILSAAREVFGKRGAEASMDEVAKKAGVGPGTLYRHFPNRDALIDALMDDWAQRVRADSKRVVDDDSPPREKLEAWLGRFITNVGIYKGAASKLVTAMDDPSSPIYRKCQVLVEANDHVMNALRTSGAVREGVENREVLRLASGMADVVDRANIGADEIRPMTTILIDGILRS
jgi:AcrR family transcriptional regulator